MSEEEEEEVSGVCASSRPPASSSNQFGKGRLPFCTLYTKKGYTSTMLVKRLKSVERQHGSNVVSILKANKGDIVESERSAVLKGLEHTHNAHAHTHTHTQLTIPISRESKSPMSCL